MISSTSFILFSRQTFNHSYIIQTIIQEQSLSWKQQKSDMLNVPEDQVQVARVTAIHLRNNNSELLVTRLVQLVHHNHNNSLIPHWCEQTQRQVASYCQVEEEEAHLPLDIIIPMAIRLRPVILKIIRHMLRRIVWVSERWRKKTLLVMAL